MRFSAFVLLGMSSAASSAAAFEVDRSLPRVVIDSDEYTATPSGYVLSHCVYQVPHQATTAREQGSNHVSVSLDGRLLGMAPPCHPLVNEANPVIRANLGNLAPHEHAKTPTRPKSKLRRQLQLPEDYNGWLQYTAFHNETGFDVFTSVMSVPDTPKAEPQILYLFPGLQNIDWIPKVDPMPKVPFDIIQPVLQYPYFGEGSNGRDWGVRSWYVTVKNGAFMSTEKLVKSGDNIICNMTRTGPESWFIGSKIGSTGVETNQNVNEKRLAIQPWAYDTVECYGCRSCDTYPDDEFSITENKISSFEHGPAEILWESNPKPAEKLLCKEKTDIISGDTVKFSFQ